MHSISPSLALPYDRPIFGAVALAACLAGGTSTQSMTAIPAMSLGADRIDASIRFAPPAAPVRPLALATATRGPEVTPAHLSVAMAVAPSPARVPLDVEQPLEVWEAPVSAPLLAATARPAPLGSVPAAVLEAAPEPVPATETVNFAAVPVVQPLVETTVAPAPAPTAPALQLVSSPELRKFDLADYHKSVPREGRFAAARKVTPVAGRTAPAASKARTTTRLIDEVLYHQTAISVGGQSGGDIAVRIGPDMKPSVKVGDLLSLVSAQMDPDALARFSLASGAQDYVSFADLRSAGFEVQYNAGANSIAISVAP